MKKYIILLGIILIALVGCEMANVPASKVDELFSKYQRLDDDIVMGINNVISEQNLTDDHRDRYRKLLEKQYKNLTYEIKNDSIDGDKAKIVVAIEVFDYRNAISDLTFDSSVYTKDTYDEEKISRLEGVKDRVTYTLEINLTRDNYGEWRIDALTNEELKKIQGMY